MLNCNIIVSKFKLQSHYYIHFYANIIGKGMNLFILQIMGQIVTLLFFHKDGFGIK